ncbi:MAG: M56 family metallopeptidase [Cellvibrionaceae bacterium]
MEMISMKNNFLDLIFQEDGSLQFLGELLVFNVRAVFLLAFCLLILRFITMSASTRHVILATALMSTALLPFYAKIFPSVDIVLETSKDNPSFIDKSMMQLFEITDKFSFEPEKNTMSTLSDFEVVLPVSSGGDVGLHDFQLEPLSYSDVDWSYYLLAAYFSGIIFLLAKVLWSNFVVFLVVTSAVPCAQNLWQKTVDKYCLSFWIRKQVEVRFSKAVMSPVTWGFFNPVILIPDDAVNWSEELVKSTVLHELAHVKRADWLVKQVVRCICAIYWFNPYIWRVFRKMMSNLETAADDMALSAGLNKTSYAGDLVSVIEKLGQPRALNFSAVGMASVRSELGQRIEFILNPKNSHAQTSIFGFMFSVFVMFGVIVPLASFQPNFQQKIIGEEIVDDVPQSNKKDLSSRYSESNDLNGSVPYYAVDRFLLSQKELLFEEYSAILAGLSAHEKNVNDNVLPKEKIVDLPAKSVMVITVEKIKNLKESHASSRTSSGIVDGVAEDVNGRVASQVVSVQLDEGSLNAAGQNVANANKLKVSTLESTLEGKGNSAESAVDIQFNKGSIASDKHNLLVAFLKDVGVSNGGINSEKINTVKPRRIVTPKYPESARRRGIEGEVVVRYQVDSSGQIVNPMIIEASPKGVFDKSVIKALSRSSYYVPASSSRSSSQSPTKNADITTVEQVQELYKFVLDA